MNSPLACPTPVAACPPIRASGPRQPRPSPRVPAILATSYQQFAGSTWAIAATNSTPLMGPL
ncbi:hypothetical protein MMYC01_207277 [Madurella mycetomatis]|uniref:Uncharacterized protein n=1 Tax=Madurella mycetomatis TaxID=100816 RepID=A0A175VZJ9_9PEZI|nr:hypothetical protein MMYC01_207277 [Madurella mycetomatis]